MQWWLYAVWASASFFAFARFPAARAVWWTLVGGWLLLPPAGAGQPSDPLVLPYWIIGSALPSLDWWNKAWSAPLLAATGSLLFDRERWCRLRAGPADLLLALFCAWPLAQTLLGAPGNPRGGHASLYLFGVWALPWLLGRLYLSSRDELVEFAATLTLATLVLLPLALAEGVSRWRLHGTLLGPHPFAYDGIDRYVGYRPQLLFEHGNQYGLWCAAAALAAFWLWRHRGGRGWGGAAALLTAMTLAAQSVGAIALAIVAILALLVPRVFRWIRAALPLVLGISALVAGLHVSGTVPLRQLAETTVAGQTVRSVVAASGRQSFSWRLGQDVKTLPLIQAELLRGHGRWDWFRSAGTRPWGFPLLLLGQYGLFALAALAGAFAVRFAVHVRAAAAGSGAAQLCAAMLLLFALDALLNSFLLYPAIVFAAAAMPRQRGRERADARRASEGVASSPSR